METYLTKHTTKVKTDFILLPFTTTYRCELRFFYVIWIKNKGNKALESKRDVHVVLSNCVPNWVEIMKRK
jgi:hypothetical protein